jgi:hypothetical protein
VAAVRRRPRAPLRSIDRAEIAILVGPFVPDRNAVVFQIFDVGVAFEKPEQFVDDRFQRQYFPLWTATEAGPAADPDGDRFSNSYEAMTETNPTSAASFKFLIEQIELVRNVPRVSWQSDIGKQYQLYGKADVAGAAWQVVGGPVMATSNFTMQSDAPAATGNRFYKLKLLP